MIQRSLHSHAARQDWHRCYQHGDPTERKPTSIDTVLVETCYGNNTDRPTWKTLLAFAIIYFVWGSTFLAIRVGVREVPPFLLAAIRFVVAGLALYGWTIANGERSPSGREWMSASLIAILIFVFDYGLLFWAEQRVPSGIAAVMRAMIPVFMALSEIIFLRTQRLTLRLAFALMIGIGGVAVLVSRSLSLSSSLGGAPIDRLGAMALMVASISWSIASVLTRKLPLPASKVMSSGAQMLAGGVFLALRGGVVCVGVFDCRGIDYRVHRLRVADSS
jgi:drug/metabolite transporter (DMT)-like permease